MELRLLTTRGNSSTRAADSLQPLLAIILTALLCHASNALEIKGLNYIAWTSTGLLSSDSDISLTNAKNIGCDWIGLNVSWFQDDFNSTSIAPDYSLYSPTLESVVHAINKCHALGMKVMLKPMVECRDGTWRGNINPSTAWFTSYQNFINYWATVAEANNVELFCAGVEYAKTAGWSSSWRNVIQSIRTHYTGPVTYGANPCEDTNINWWDALDYIGIDAYYPLTDQNDPTPAQLQTAWDSRADTIEAWRNSHWPNMRIIFTEIGYRSIDGVNKAPWFRPPGTFNIDLQEQADCYNALLSQCQNRSWWMGVFWWNWEVNPNFGGPDNAFYVPHNKPAEAVIADYYICLRGDLTADAKINYKDLGTLAAYWLSYHPSVDIYPTPDGDGTIDYHDFAALAKNWMIGLNLAGDINGDCKVDLEDLRRLTGKWLLTCKPGSISEELNGDGWVNLKDYALLAGSWMQASPMNIIFNYSRKA